MSTLVDALTNEPWYLPTPPRAQVNAVTALVTNIVAIFRPTLQYIFLSRGPDPFLYLELTMYFHSFTPERLAMVMQAVNMCEAIPAAQGDEAGWGWVQVKRGREVRIVSTRWVGWWIEEVRQGSRMEFWIEEWESGDKESEENGYEAGDEQEEELEAGEEDRDERQGEVEIKDEDEDEDEEQDEADEFRDEEIQDDTEKENESDIIHKEGDADQRPSWEETFQRRYDRMRIQARIDAMDALRRQSLINRMYRLDRHKQG